MRREELSDLPVFPDPAAQVQILERRHNRLVDQIIRRASILTTFLLLNGLDAGIKPGNILHSFCLYLLTGIDRTHYENRSTIPLAAPLSMELQTLGIRAVDLTRQQETIVGALNQFHQVFIPVLIKKIFKNLGVRFNQDQSFEVLRTVADILESEAFISPDGKNTVVTISSEFKQACKVSLISRLNYLNVITRQEGQTEMTMTFRQIVALLKKTYGQLLHEFKSEEVAWNIANTHLLEILIDRHFFSFTFHSVATLSTMLINHYIVAPTIKSAYRRVQPQPAFRQDDQRTLQHFINKNNRLETLNCLFSYFVNFMFPLIVAALVLHDYLMNRKSSPPLIIAYLCLIPALLYGHYEDYHRLIQQQSLEKINEISAYLDQAIACTQQRWQLYRGELSSESYFHFQAKKYRQLSSIQVNKAVQEIFFRQKTAFLAIHKTSQSIEPLPLTSQRASEINEQIKIYLNQLVDIQALKQQIHRYFYQSQIIEVSTCSQEGHPEAEFIIPCLPIKNLKLNQVKTLFPHCRSEHRDPFLIIRGAKPKRNFSIAEPLHYTLTEEKITAPVGVKPSASQCETHRLQHPLFAHHFVLFSIPQRCFPDQKSYQAAKAIVEEARLDEHRLKFRTGIAVDQTQSGNKTYRYRLFAQLTGIRLFAEPIATGGHTVHVFKSATVGS